MELFTIFNLVWKRSFGRVFKKWRFFPIFFKRNRLLNDGSRIFAIYRRNNSTSWILCYRYTEDSRNAIFWTFVNFKMREIAVLFEAMTVKNTYFLAERATLYSLLKLPDTQPTIISLCISIYQIFLLTFVERQLYMERTALTSCYVFLHSKIKKKSFSCSIARRKKFLFLWKNIFFRIADVFARTWKEKFFNVSFSFGKTCSAHMSKKCFFLVQ